MRVTTKKTGLVGIPVCERRILKLSAKEMAVLEEAHGILERMREHDDEQPELASTETWLGELLAEMRERDGLDLD